MARGIKGAIIFGVLGASVAGWALSANDPYNEAYPVIVFCIDAATDNCVAEGEFYAGVAGRGVAEAPDKLFEFVGMPTETLGAAIGALSLETGVVDALTADGAYADNLE